jgi:hypothetical protein
MSVVSGPMALNAASRAVSAKVPGRSMTAKYRKKEEDEILTVAEFRALRLMLRAHEVRVSKHEAASILRDASLTRRSSG